MSLDGFLRGFLRPCDVHDSSFETHYNNKKQSAARPPSIAASMLLSSSHSLYTIERLNQSSPRPLKKQHGSRFMHVLRMYSYQTPKHKFRTKLGSIGYFLICYNLLWRTDHNGSKTIKYRRNFLRNSKGGFIKDEYCSWVQYKSGPGGGPSM
jgi:hypothetical protein